METKEIFEVLPSTGNTRHSGLKAVSALGFMVGGALLGSASAHVYNKKVHSAQRNIELLLVWMLKNVRLNVGEDQLGVQVGPAKLSFGKASKSETKRKSKSDFVDDDDIEIN